jgi:hypothetical protein
MSEYLLSLGNIRSTRSPTTKPNENVGSIAMKVPIAKPIAIE